MHRSRDRFRKFAWAYLAYTMAVILWGAFVRATGSGAGCGAHWPMCNGELVPRSPPVETLIELTHRVTSGLAWLLAPVLVVWARRAFPKAHGARRASGLVLLFMTTEALVGAGLVLFEMVADNASMARAVWMSAHLINTFVLLAAMSATVWYSQQEARVRLRFRGSASALLAVASLAVLVLGVSGAVTALGDTLFPASSVREGFAQDLSPSAHLFVRLRVLHPVIGLATGALVLFAAGMAASLGRATRRLAITVIGVFVAQVAVGFVNVALLAPVALQLTHLLLADVLWIGLVFLLLTTLALEPAREPVESGAPQLT
jgi:heme A synthase